MRIFRGLGQPVDIALLPRVNVGMVRSRYALVADARGSVDLLDLDAGTIVHRVAVAGASSITVAGSYAWIASAGRRALTQLDLDPARGAHVVARIRLAIVPAALAPDPGAVAVDAVSRGGELIRIEAVSLAQSRVGALGGRVTQLLTGYHGLLWAAEEDGRVLGVRARDGKVLKVMHVPAGSRVEIVFGWLAAAHAHTLRMLALGTPRPGTATTLPSVSGSFAFASFG